MSKAPTPTDLMLAAQALQQDVSLDLRGVPAHRRPDIVRKLNILEQRIDKASRLLMDAALNGVEGK